MLLKKIDRARMLLLENQEYLECPKCRTALVVDNYSLVCTNQHRFDLSKKGTLNFLTHQISSEYDVAMFQHRQNMIKAGLYQPLVERIKHITNLELANNIIDVGCGEGSLLNQLAPSDTEFLVGFDIAKSGINLATEQPIQANWWIADLTQIPVAANSVDTILNIFSPSHYQEFKRLLKNNGQLVKVVPGKHYLKELRELFFADNPDKIDYSNEKVVVKLDEEMRIINKEKLCYKFPVSLELARDLLYMSPIHWHSSRESQEQVLNGKVTELTIDVEIFVCEK